MNITAFKKLKIPDNPGIYIFKDLKNRPIYIGRATSLKDRLKSYFKDDLIETRGPRIVDMVTKAKKIDWQETSSVLEAIILESNLIKKYQPAYNVDEKDNKSSMYVVITDEIWPRVFLMRARDLEQSIIDNGGEDNKSSGNRKVSGFKILEKFGPFPNSGLIKEALKILRKLFPFKDKKSFDPRHDSFYKSIGRSPEGNDTEAREKYLKTIEYLILFFEGKQSEIRKRLQEDMDKYVKELKFESANECKKLLYALEHINDISLIKKDKESVLHEFRIEAYDIAHLSGDDVVGAMAVSLNGDNEPGEYRRFKLSQDKNDDVNNLGEILFRRLNHTEWRYPDLIVVDGNDVQFRRTADILKARRIDIPVVAVTKNLSHKAEKIIGREDIVKKYKKEIISLNAEVHRFAIAYHRKRRGRKFLV